MQNRHTLFLVATITVGLAPVCGAQAPEKAELFPAGIILIGTKTLDDPNACAIQVVSPTGTDVRTMFRREGRSFSSGRLSRKGDRLAFCYVASDRKEEFWMIDSKGEATKIMDGGGRITAWSPDGKQLAFYQGVPGSDWLESFVIDLTSGERTKLELPADYAAEDWHPRENIRTAIYRNPRNRIYRNNKSDSYPVRQLDVLTADGKKVPLTKDPSFDNIWSQFSPTGDHIAHYRRRFVDGRPREYAVVCAADGSQATEVLGFTDIGDASGLFSFRPLFPPAWSPDGSIFAWLVTTKAEPTSDMKLELAFISASGGNLRRVSLTERGFKWVGGIDWR